MLRIALAQINSTVGDLAGNREKIAQAIIRARQMAANIVVFPELAITGYPPEDLLFKKNFVADNLKTLRSLVGQTANITAIIGFVDNDPKGRLFNSAAVIHNRKFKGVYHKCALPNYGVFDERRYFTPGEENFVFTLGQNIFGISICEDIWVKDGPCQGQKITGAQVLINLFSSPYHAGKVSLRESMLIARAKTNKAFVCYVNLVGGQDELVFDGASMIIDPKGKIIAFGKQFEEDLIMADVELEPFVKLRKKGFAKAVVLSESFDSKGRLPISGQKPKRLEPIEEIYKALVLGTRDYIQKNGFKKVVLGLSGGIDSALTAIIAADAIGKENVVGISMSSKFTSQGTKSDAKKLAENLGIVFKEVPIENIQNTFLETLKEEFQGRAPDIAEENLQARIRGNLLMAFSNKFGWLVLTTGNKSEIAMGYCTLYGDMAGGFAVIKDIPKTKVYELARFRNQKEGRELIPESVFTRPPTAELRENQKDEDSLPPYAILDPILEEYVELDKSVSKIKSKMGDAKLIKSITNTVDRMEYKRRQAPPGIKITPKAFGKDRRLPITNRYKED